MRRATQAEILKAADDLGFELCKRFEHMGDAEGAVFILMRRVLMDCARHARPTEVIFELLRLSVIEAAAEAVQPTEIH